MAAYCKNELSLNSLGSAIINTNRVAQRITQATCTPQCFLSLICGIYVVFQYFLLPLCSVNNLLINTAQDMKNKFMFVVHDILKSFYDATDNQTETKTRGRLNGASPPVLSRHCFGVSCRDLPSLFNH